nr:MAG TPA: hypothetical protein [Caudoviricetes sp.]
MPFARGNYESNAAVGKPTIGIRTPSRVPPYRLRPENNVLSSFAHGALRSIAALNLP